MPDAISIDIDARPVRFQGSKRARGALALMDWRVVFDGLPCKQGVIVMARIASLLQHRRGFHPERAAPIRLSDEGLTRTTAEARATTDCERPA